MKKIKILLTITSLMLSLFVISQDYQIGLSLDPLSGYINVQMRVVNGPIPGSPTANRISKIEFGIMWDRTAVNGNKLDLDLACSNVNPYHLTRDEHPLPYNTSGWDYRNFVLIENTQPFSPPPADMYNWSHDEWVTILQLKVFPRTPGGGVEPHGHFAIVPNKDHFNKSIDPVIQVKGINYFVNVLPIGDPMNNPIFNIPTILIGYVWVGGNGNIQDGDDLTHDDYSWNHGPNWSNDCGGEGEFAEDPPGIYDDCLIYNVDGDGESGCYPRYNQQTNSEIKAVGQDIFVLAGGKIEWMKNPGSKTDKPLLQTWGNLDIDGTSVVEVYSNGQIDIGGDTTGWVAPLVIKGTGGLVIKDGGWVNTKYRTTIKANPGLIIESNINGTGSFINIGKVLYENGGTVKIQTFISGTEDVYHMHFAGPTVKDVSYGQNGGLTGVRLEQFNMTTLDTYAFEWDPSVDSSIIDPNIHLYRGWVNVWPFEYNVKVANGLAITNGDVGSGTMDMIGFLNSDTAVPVQYQIHCASSPIENQLELLSNPFSSAIDFDLLYNHVNGDINNSNLICPKYMIWDDEIGNYGGYVVGLFGDHGHIQVGQGFFVQTKTDGILEFPTSIRKHSDVAFRELITNKLELNVEGGETFFKDGLTIYFTDEATNSYDEDLELKKWNSIHEDATMIRSITNDGEELAINAVALTDFYQQEVVSVPVHFQCGYEGEYTFNFTGVESFDPGAEIWLEDLHINNNNNIERSLSIPITIENSVYTFTASPDDEHARFIIHFFGPGFLPNSVDEIIESKVKIYSSGHSTYVMNNSDEIIKEITIYNMLGQEVMKAKVPAQNIHKLEVNVQTGYYAVRVLTNKNLYSEKVFIKGN